jgi:hypothetical protein
MAEGLCKTPNFQYAYTYVCTRNGLTFVVCYKFGKCFGKDDHFPDFGWELSLLNPVVVKSCLEECIQERDPFVVPIQQKMISCAGFQVRN